MPKFMLLFFSDIYKGALGGICRFSATIDCVSKRNMFLVDKRNKINSTFSMVNHRNKQKERVGPEPILFKLMFCN